MTQNLFQFIFNKTKSFSNYILPNNATITQLRSAESPDNATKTNTYIDKGTITELRSTESPKGNFFKNDPNILKSNNYEKINSDMIERPHLTKDAFPAECSPGYVKDVNDSYIIIIDSKPTKLISLSTDPVIFADSKRTIETQTFFSNIDTMEINGEFRMGIEYSTRSAEDQTVIITKLNLESQLNQQLKNHYSWIEDYNRIMNLLNGIPSKFDANKFFKDINTSPTSTTSTCENDYTVSKTLDQYLSAELFNADVLGGNVIESNNNMDGYTTLNNLDNSQDFVLPNHTLNNINNSQEFVLPNPTINNIDLYEITSQISDINSNYNSDDESLSNTPAIDFKTALTEDIQDWSFSTENALDNVYESYTLTNNSEEVVEVFIEEQLPEYSPSNNLGIESYSSRINHITYPYGGEDMYGYSSDDSVYIDTPSSEAVVVNTTNYPVDISNEDQVSTPHTNDSTNLYVDGNLEPVNIVTAELVDNSTSELASLATTEKVITPSLSLIEHKHTFKVFIEKLEKDASSLMDVRADVNLQLQDSVSFEKDRVNSLLADRALDSLFNPFSGLSNLSLFTEAATIASSSLLS